MSKGKFMVAVDDLSRRGAPDPTILYQGLSMGDALALAKASLIQGYEVVITREEAKG